jgi:hypothetical protein
MQSITLKQPLPLLNGYGPSIKKYEEHGPLKRMQRKIRRGYKRITASCAGPKAAGLNRSQLQCHKLEALDTFSFTQNMRFYSHHRKV